MRISRAFVFKLHHVANSERESEATAWSAGKEGFASNPTVWLWVRKCTRQLEVRSFAEEHLDLPLVALLLVPVSGSDDEGFCLSGGVGNCSVRHDVLVISPTL
jgi:hypothetical protein